MSRALLCHLCSWVLAATAWAGDPAGSLEGQTRVELDLSTPIRFSQQRGLNTTLTVSGGLTPGYGRLTAAHFFHPAIGVTADVAADVFGIKGSGFTDNEVKGLENALQASASALGRLRLMDSLAVEAQAGFLYGQVPTLSIGGQFTDVIPANLTLMGPLVGAQVRWDASGPISAQAGARWVPLSVSTRRPAGIGVEASAKSASQLQAGLAVLYRLPSLGPTHLSAGLSYEYALATAHDDSNSGPTYDLQHYEHRIGLSVRGWLAPAGADLKGLDRPPSGPGRIHGLVVREGNAPIAGAKVELPGKDPVLTGADGRFQVEQVPPGPLAMSVSAAGFKARSESVTVAPGGELKLTVTLQPPTGPGRIKGAAFAAAAQQGGPRAPLADVTIEGPKGAVHAGADGTFTLDEVGPGPVQVKATLKGYKPAEEVVSVPPEGEASLELTLVREAARVLASMRGQVRTLRGKPVSALLKIPEAQISTRTGPDGRFAVRLPGGKYTVVFEAAGYVRQTKTVEVADGDQAIFYVDLSREDR